MRRRNHCVAVPVDFTGWEWVSLEQNQSARLIVECIPNLEIFCSNKDPSSAPAAAVAVFLNRLRKVFLLGSLLVAAAAVLVRGLGELEWQESVSLWLLSRSPSSCRNFRPGVWRGEGRLARLEGLGEGV